MSRPPADPNFLALTGRKVRPSRAKNPEVQSEAVCARPPMPSYLDDVARKEWRRLVALLLARGTVTKLDCGLLELASTTYSRYRACLEEIEEHGAFTDTLDGRVEAAASKAATRLAAQLRQIQIQLGATPQSRQKVQKAAVDPATQPATPGSLADLLRQAAARVEETSESEGVDLDSIDENSVSA